jgi:alpha-D-xyloside xylohydrolase
MKTTILIKTNRYYSLLLLAGLVFFACGVARADDSISAYARALLKGDTPAGAGAKSGKVIRVPAGNGEVRLKVCTDSIVRVTYAADASFYSRISNATAPKRCLDPHAVVVSGPRETIVSTAKLKVHVDRSTGRVVFRDALDREILAEKQGGGRTVTPAVVQGEQTYTIRQEWEPSEHESLYGLGQHQQGLMKIKGYYLDFSQYNTEIFVPFLVSSRGYGILWDNTSFTRFGDVRMPEPIPGVAYDANGNVEGVSAGRLVWEGQVQAPTTGDYLFYTYAAGGIKLDINGQHLIDHWRQGWLPNTEVAKVYLKAGQSVPVRLEWTAQWVNTLQFVWKTPTSNPTTSLWSEVGEGIDYYFVYGPDLDAVVADYRLLTGTAPMMPRWAYGFWQCREHYQTAQEVLAVLDGYRSRAIPIDNIVQDWQYWKDLQWGSHEFDETRYPDPEGWIQTIHEKYRAQLMLSVWPKFNSTTANFTELDAKGFIYRQNIIDGHLDFQQHPYAYYDAFNPDARKLYWSQIERSLWPLGVDAWWLDATEPEAIEGPYATAAIQREAIRTHMGQTALGSASRVLNAYSLYNSQAVYEGLREVAPDQRVFILTRNGFAGQQRYAAASWSGDITSTWTAMKKQIPAGLSYSISGLPYWTVDSGGFSVPDQFLYSPTPEAQDEWAELNTRWFEYATFLPILRVHGQWPYREMWAFGGDTSPAFMAQRKFDELRYRLLPYIYSLAGEVTHRGGTILRPLVMDFAHDAKAQDIGDQFMFGPALLVNPVTTYQARSRSVYLPAAALWYDFWTGATALGGKTVEAAAPYDAIPVYVRAGSIVPVGPAMQYTTEKPADPIILYVYLGADGSFVLYEDDGATFDYEKGAFASIPVLWNDSNRTLVIGKRIGSFAGMLQKRTFQVVLVSPTKAVGYSATPTVDQTVEYEGDEVVVSLRRRAR